MFQDGSAAGFALAGFGQEGFELAGEGEDLSGQGRGLDAFELLFI